ncbi:Sporulation factor SpoIIGA [compost metagenome]
MVVASRRTLERVDSCLAEVQVRIEEITVKCTGLIDTGNQLKDPLTRWPVMVMEASLWGQVLPESFIGRLAAEQADNLIMEWTDEESFPWRDRLRLVPYRGINRGSQFMLALKPDEVAVLQDGRKLTTSRVLIGLDGGKLSAEATYRAIIHPILMEGIADGAALPASAAAKDTLSDSQKGSSISTPGP